MKNLKILILGHCSYYTIANYAEMLKQNVEGVKVTVADPFNPSGKALSEKELGVFDRVIHIPSKREIKIGINDRIKSAGVIIKNKIGLRDFLFNMISFRFKKVRYTIDSFAENSIHGKMLNELFRDYDVFHFHYAAPCYLYPIKYVPENKVKIISIWGSDLFQTSGIKNYSDQLSAFELSDFIIVNTLEKREIFLSKFGRVFADKIRFANFGVSECKLARMESFQKSGNAKEFKKKYGIRDEKAVIIIGYNASSKQNHLAIIKAMNGIDAAIKARLHLIFPLTYGFSIEREDYIMQIKNACSGAGFDFTIIDDYIPEEEYFGMLYSCDIKINLRETDSMNSAMLESAFAGNILINGAWHPYGILRRLGVYCREAVNIEELDKLVSEIVNNLKNEKSKTAPNAELIRSYFSSVNTGMQWKKFFDEVRRLVK
ncbi:MAG: hypothetical protein HGGPFJEG_01304 [Ignavibacteria bacterium]|nr:hypothetical protein [Ignavibacteria bacterium]